MPRLRKTGPSQAFCMRFSCDTLCRSEADNGIRRWGNMLPNVYTGWLGIEQMTKDVWMQDVISGSWWLQ